MSSKAFCGFPNKMGLVRLPSLFFSALLPQMDNLTELKVVLYIFWLLEQKKSYPKFVTFGELLSDRILLKGINESQQVNQALQTALESAVKRGILLHLEVDKEGRKEDLYFLNTQANREVVASRGGELLPTEEKPKADIFTLYEQNIGLLTPLIAEELKEAEKLYPKEWIAEAFKEAASLNKRNWRYIARILERWATEGKGGEPRRDIEKGKVGKYLKGRYGHLVRR